MPDFSSGRIDAKGNLVFPSDNNSLGLELPPTAGSPPSIQSVGIIQGFNLGDGQGIYTTFDLNGTAISGLKSLVGGAGVTLTTDQTTITINSVSADSLSSLVLTNVGSGAGLFRQKIAGDVQLRSIQGGGIVAVQQGDNTVTVSANAVTSVGVSASSDFICSGSPITSTGNIDIALSDTGIAAGTYTNVALTIDTKGRVRAATPIQIDPVTVQAGSGLIVSDGPNYTVGLPATTVAPGIYVAPSLIVDQYGRITNATSNTIPGPASGYNLGSGAATLKSFDGQQAVFRSLIGSGTIDIVESDDSITISAPSAGTVTSVSATGANGISITGGPINTVGTITVGLTQTGVAGGRYEAATISVDEFGRITSAASNAIGETNTASNLPGGYGLFAQKVGADLQFKPISAGPGISVSVAGQTVVVSAEIASMPVSGLPQNPVVGQRSFVTDSQADGFNTQVVGGGSTPVPVFYNGSTWMVG